MDATAGRSILLRLALVVAVLAGLLTMHTLVTAPPHPAVAATVTVTVEHHPAEAGGAPSESAAPDDCGSSECDPLHGMGLMTCLLALLVAVVLVGAAPPAGGWMRESPEVARALVADLRSFVSRPPSLIALSISRT